jgi:hypothetical protein
MGKITVRCAEACRLKPTLALLPAILGESADAGA